MGESASRSEQAEGNFLMRRGVALANWAEQWFPDPLVFAMCAIVVVFVAGLAAGSSTSDLVQDFGEGFWKLIPFTMQMVMIIIGGSVVANSPPVARIIRRLATVPRTPRGAVAFVAFVSSTSSLISWGFSLVFSALLVRAIVQKVRGVDYRAAGAAAYLGVGSVWGLGLSSSAALLMATPGSVPRELLRISGWVPLTETIFAWQSMLSAVVLMIVSVTVAYLSAPAGAQVKTAEALGVKIDPPPPSEKRKTPGEWLEYNGVLSVLIAALGFAYIAKLVWAKGLRSAVDLNTYNFLFLMTGLILHWRPRSFVRAVGASVPATAGVLIQFPFYAGIFGIVTQSPISQKMAQFFVRVSTHGTYPLLVTMYSAVLGMFVPSGGSKWLIEAPYVLQAAIEHRVNLGWVIQVYNTAEALPNLINPFWMLPLLGLLGLRARQMVGFTALQLAINLPLVLLLMWLLAYTLPYKPPVPF